MHFHVTTAHPLVPLAPVHPIYSPATCPPACGNAVVPRSGAIMGTMHHSCCAEGCHEEGEGGREDPMGPPGGRDTKVSILPCHRDSHDPPLSPLPK